MKLENGIDLHINQNEENTYNISINKQYQGNYRTVSLIDNIIDDLQDLTNELEEFRYKQINKKEPEL